MQIGRLRIDVLTRVGGMKDQIPPFPLLTHHPITCYVCRGKKPRLWSYGVEFTGRVIMKILDLRTVIWNDFSKGHKDNSD